MPLIRSLIDSLVDRRTAHQRARGGVAPTPIQDPSRVLCVRASRSVQDCGVDSSNSCSSAPADGAGSRSARFAAHFMGSPLGIAFADPHHHRRSRPVACIEVVARRATAAGAAVAGHNWEGTPKTPGRRFCREDRRFEVFHHLVDSALNLRRCGKKGSRLAEAFRRSLETRRLNPGRPSRKIQGQKIQGQEWQ